MPWLANYGTYGSFRGIAEFLVKMQSFDAPYTFVTAKVDELRHDISLSSARVSSTRNIVLRNTPSRNRCFAVSFLSLLSIERKNNLQNQEIEEIAWFSPATISCWWNEIIQWCLVALLNSNLLWVDFCLTNKEEAVQKFQKKFSIVNRLMVK